MRGISLRGIDRRSFGLPARGERRPLKPLKERNPVAVALVGLALLAIIALGVFFQGDLPIIGGGTGYTAYFAEAAGLQPGNEVRIAGVTVGKVTGVSLAGAKVAVTFQVKNAWVGDRTTAAIDIKTVLGDKYLALDPLGPAQQNPGTPIPLSRTTSPYDVTQAFSGVGQADQQDQHRPARREPGDAIRRIRRHPALRPQRPAGLADLSKSVASKDSEVTSLLAEARTGHRHARPREHQIQRAAARRQPAARRTRSSASRRSTRCSLDTQALASRAVRPGQRRPGDSHPGAAALDQVTSVLQNDQADLAAGVALAGPYYRLLGNALGNGRWFDIYLCGLIPHSVAPANTPATGCAPPKP